MIGGIPLHRAINWIKRLFISSAFIVRPENKASSIKGFNRKPRCSNPLMFTYWPAIAENLTSAQADQLFNQK